MSIQELLLKNIKTDDASAFLFNYLLLPIECGKVFYPKSKSETVVRDEFKIIMTKYTPEFSEDFVDEVASLWMRNGRIAYCSEDIYKPVLETIKEKKAYSFVKEMKRLAYQGFYTQFPQFSELQDIKKSWQNIIERILFNQSCDPDFYEEICKVWSNYLEHSYVILKKCILDQNIDRFTNRMYFLTLYGLDLRAMYKKLKQDVPLELSDRWEKLISIRAQNKSTHEVLGDFNNKMLFLLEDLDPFRNAYTYIKSENEYDFLLEYFYLSEAGMALKFPLSLNNIVDTKKVWREVIEKVVDYEAEDFIKNVSVLWLRLIKKIHKKHEYWVDEVMYDLILFLEQEIKTRENVKAKK